MEFVVAVDVALPSLSHSLTALRVHRILSKTAHAISIEVEKWTRRVKNNDDVCSPARETVLLTTTKYKAKTSIETEREKLRARARLVAKSNLLRVPTVNASASVAYLLHTSFSLSLSVGSSFGSNEIIQKYNWLQQKAKKNYNKKGKKRQQTHAMTHTVACTRIGDNDH